MMVVGAAMVLQAYDFEEEVYQHQILIKHAVALRTQLGRRVVKRTLLYQVLIKTES